MFRVAGFVVVFSLSCLWLCTQPIPQRDVSTVEEGRLTADLIFLGESPDHRNSVGGLQENVARLDVRGKVRAASAIRGQLRGFATSDLSFEKHQAMMAPYLRALTALDLPARCAGRSVFGERVPEKGVVEGLDTYFKRNENALAVKNYEGLPVSPWDVHTKGKGARLASAFLTLVPSTNRNEIGDLEANAKALTGAQRVLLENELLRDILKEASINSEPAIAAQLRAITALRVATACGDEPAASITPAKAAAFDAAKCPAKTQPIECYSNGLIYLNKSGGYDTGDRTQLCRVSSAECEGRPEGFRFCAPCDGEVSCGGCSQHARRSSSQRRRPGGPEGTTHEQPRDKDADRPVLEGTIAYPK